MEILARRQRVLSLSVIVVTGLCWSVAMGVFGFWLIFEPQAVVLSSMGIRYGGGLAVLCGAQVVFLMCIADRVFSRAHLKLTRTIEVVLGAIFFVCSCVLAVSAVLDWVIV